MSHVDRICLIKLQWAPECATKLWRNSVRCWCEEKASWSVLGMRHSAIQRICNSIPKELEQRWLQSCRGSKTRLLQKPRHGDARKHGKYTQLISVRGLLPSFLPYRVGCLQNNQEYAEKNLSLFKLDSLNLKSSKRIAPEIGCTIVLTLRRKHGARLKLSSS